MCVYKVRVKKTKQKNRKLSKMCEVNGVSQEQREDGSLLSSNYRFELMRKLIISSVFFFFYHIKNGCLLRRATVPTRDWPVIGP